MKYKAKFADWLLHIGTIAVIILSTVLWILTMTTEDRFARVDSRAQTNQQTKARNFKGLNTAFAPTKVYEVKGNQVYQIYDPERNLALEFTKGLFNGKIGKVTLVSQNSQTYRSYLRNAGYLQLSFTDQIDLSAYSDLVKVKQNYGFNRIFVAKSKTKTDVLLGNDRNGRLYRVQLSKADFSALIDYADHAQQKIAVDFQKVGDLYCPFYDQEQVINVYSYLVSNQADGYFVSKLLGTSGISSKTDANGTLTYSAGIYNRLTVPKDNTNHLYTYLNYGKSAMTKADDRVADSLASVRQLGIAEVDLHFFDHQGGKVYYTNYVEGLPVFIPDFGPQFELSFSNESMMMRFDSTSLQIPIPADNRTVKLPKTTDVLSQLAQKGISQTAIQNITIGYELQIDTSSKNLVNLIPTYYIKAFGQWKSLAEWQAINLTSLLISANNQSMEE